MTPEERFMSKVSPEPNSGCWLWMGYCDKSGYAKFAIKRKPLYGHRVSYEFAKGKIQDKMEIDHICSNKSCVNPDHLEMVTSGENKKRMYARGERATITHCVNGHPRTEKNAYYHDGRRHCLPCKRKRGRDSWRKANATS